MLRRLCARAARSVVSSGLLGACGPAAALPATWRSDYRQSLGGLPWEQNASFGTATQGRSSSAAAIKELRERTGAPMMDVKAALEASNYDLDAAVTELRKRGIAMAGKKAGRVAADGLVAVASGPHGVAVVEVNCETDFVARNASFQSVARAAASCAARWADAGTPSMDCPGAWELSPTGLVALPLGDGPGTLAESVTAAAAAVGEHVRVRRVVRLSGGVDDGDAVVAWYLHGSPVGAVGAGLGTTAGVVALNAPPTDRAIAESLAQKLALHVVGARPRYTRREDVPPSAVAAEADVLRAQATASGKPPAIVDKMVQGRLAAFYKEACLLEQKFVMDDALTVAQLIAKAGPGVTLRGWVRLERGAGVVRDVKDFAAEVAAVAKG